MFSFRSLGYIPRSVSFHGLLSIDVLYITRYITFHNLLSLVKKLGCSMFIKSPKLSDVRMLCQKDFERLFFHSFPSGYYYTTHTYYSYTSIKEIILSMKSFEGIFQLKRILKSIDNMTGTKSNEGILYCLPSKELYPREYAKN